MAGHGFPVTAEDLPDAVRRGVEAILQRERGTPTRVTDGRPVGGGCINRASRVEVEPGDPVFVKWNPDPPRGFFEAEADGLEALRERGGPRIPRPLGHGEGPGGRPAWLVLELLEPGRRSGDFGRRLGHAVAHLHRPDEGEPGWPRDNFVGSLSQRNETRARWSDFWREMRLLPQLRAARDAGLVGAEESAPLERLIDGLDDLLAGVPTEGASLLHGDLWSGNVHVGPDGEPVLLDPAVYRGHREVDLAMAHLFGGIPGGFDEAYREAFPVDEGYEAGRRDIYQLYPLLVHVNLFGRSYVGPLLDAARRVLGGG